MAGGVFFSFTIGILGLQVLLSLGILVLALLLLLVHSIQFLSVYFVDGIRITGWSGFILGFENKSCQKSGNDGSGDAPGAGSESSNEDPQEAQLVYAFLNTSRQ